MSDPFIPVILGTARPGRRSADVAHAVVDMVKERPLMTTLVDVADYPLTGTGIATESSALEGYREKSAAADGFIIVAPEYNHAYPGELKLLLDTDFESYGRKPVGFVSVSAGLVGGTRMVEQLRLLTLALRMVPVSPAVHVTEVNRPIRPDGRFTEASLQYVAAKMLDELDWYARVLSGARG